MKALQDIKLDTWISKEQSDLFKYAASIKGFDNIVDFIIDSAEEIAKQIIDEKKQILTTEKDIAIFFDAILNPPEPNEALKKAAAEYLSSLE